MPIAPTPRRPMLCHVTRCEAECINSKASFVCSRMRKVDSMHRFHTNTAANIMHNQALLYAPRSHRSTSHAEHTHEIVCDGRTGICYGRTQTQRVSSPSNVVPNSRVSISSVYLRFASSLYGTCATRSSCRVRSLTIIVLLPSAVTDRLPLGKTRQQTVQHCILGNLDITRVKDHVIANNAWRKQTVITHRNGLQTCARVITGNWFQLSLRTMGTRPANLSSSVLKTGGDRSRSARSNSLQPQPFFYSTHFAVAALH